MSERTVRRLTALPWYALFAGLGALLAHLHWRVDENQLYLPPASLAEGVRYEGVAREKVPGGGERRWAERPYRLRTADGRIISRGCQPNTRYTWACPDGQVWSSVVGRRVEASLLPTPNARSHNHVVLELRSDGKLLRSLAQCQSELRLALNTDRSGKIDWLMMILFAVAGAGAVWLRRHQVRQDRLKRRFGVAQGSSGQRRAHIDPYVGSRRRHSAMREFGVDRLHHG